MMGCLVDDAKEGGGDRNRIKKTLKQLREEEKEEYEGRALLEAMQKNVDEAYARASETKQRLYRELEEFMYFGRSKSTCTPWTENLKHP